MEKHPITEPMRQATLQAMRTKGISQTQIAEVAKLGKPWVTKFLDGTTRLIREDVMHKIEDLLGIKYHSYDAMSEDLPPYVRESCAGRLGEAEAKQAMGHTAGSTTLFRHYRRAVTKTAGVKYFR